MAWQGWASSERRLTTGTSKLLVSRAVAMRRNTAWSKTRAQRIRW